MGAFGSSRGAITVFQCIILMGLLIFSGVMTDVCRITVADRKVQSGLNSAARSVLAGYSPELAGDYGIFALNASSGSKSVKEKLMDYLTVNLKEPNGEFKFIDYHIEEATTRIWGRGNLISNEENALKEEILKYMKYRAPIAVTQTVIEKFKTSGIFEKKEFAQNEKSVREKSAEAETNIEGIGKKLTTANDELEKLKAYKANEDNLQEYVEALEQAAQSYRDAEKDIYEAVSSLEIYSEATRTSDMLAVSANTREGLRGEAAIKTYENEPGNAVSKLNEIKANVQGNIKKLGEHAGKAKGIQIAIEGFYTGNNGDGNSKTGSSDIERLIKEELHNAEAVKGLTGVEAIDTSRLEGLFGIWEEEAPETVEDSASKLSGLEEALGKILGLKAIKEDWMIDFNEADKRKDMQGSEMEDVRQKPIPSSRDDAELAEKENESILLFLDRIKAALETGAENIYVTEYIMDRFTYHTSTIRRDHFFEKGEVEYILWGNRTEKLNISNTVTAIGVLRFAVNTVDYFATSKVPHPILRLIYAVGRGIIRAGADCYDLYRGEPIDICPSLGNSLLKLNYADHLRIFLLLQAAGDSGGQLNNVRQLIQVNSKRPDGNYNLQNPGFKLSDYSTSIHCRADVKINLWFLPVLQLDKLGIKGFDGGKYVIEKEFYAAY